MNSNFMNIVVKATENKDLFDSSVGNIKEYLDVCIKATRTAETEPKPPSINATGWLRGALSYPWILVCIVIPAILDMFV